MVPANPAVSGGEVVSRGDVDVSAMGVVASTVIRDGELAGREIVVGFDAEVPISAVVLGREDVRGAEVDVSADIEVAAVLVSAVEVVTGAVVMDSAPVVRYVVVVPALLGITGPAPLVVLSKVVLLVVVGLVLTTEVVCVVVTFLSLFCPIGLAVS